MPQHPIVFSDQELTFIHDRQFLTSKLEIGKKLEQLLGKVEQNLYAIIPEYTWPSGVLIRSGKISKGENYLGLPYFLLDYPRRFDRDNVFALRTMFWWGNFFSATLHLSGEYLESSRGPLSANINLIKSSNAHICVNSNPWEYHYDRNNYCKASELTAEQLGKIISDKHFVKLSVYWEISQYINIPSLVPGVFREMLSWLEESGQK